jgi:diguanylate cyclase (GGDEF)-like protein/PAS domain S-box-containing protein
MIGIPPMGAIGRLRRLGQWLAARSVAVGLLVGVVVLALIGLTLLDARRDAWADAREASASLARALARDLSAETRAVDLALIAIIGIQDRSMTGRADPALLPALIQERIRATRFLETVVLLDARGEEVFNSGQQPAGRPISISDRDYFTVHRDRTDAGLHVSRPYRSRRAGDAWSLGFSRRLSDAEGRFAGIVLGVMRIARLEAAAFEGLSLGPRGSLTIFRDDGIILARYPFDERQVGRDLSASPAFRGALSAPSGQHVAIAAIDGVERFYSHRRLDAAPIVVNLALAVDDIYAAWWRKALAIGAIALLLVGTIIGMTILLQRELARRRAMELAARGSEATFRLLAENSADLVSRMDAEGRRLYASPAAAAIFGRSVEEMLARSALDDLVAEDVPVVQGAIARLRAGERDVMTTYRIRRPDGAIVWLEASGRAIRDAGTGRLDGIVAIARDVSARKAQEERLAALARTDGLTGLPNRRSFDEALAVEWRRARRGAQPLSLLLLDIDRFKLFNDTYGHPAGDACLRQVAGAIAAAVGRPADLVARYGGEEIVLLLPETPAAGAAAVAEQVRATVEGLGLPHAGNDPAGVVTASLGAATAIPGAEEAPEALLAAADAALYRAKRAGRNQVAVAATAAHAPSIPGS